MLKKVWWIICILILHFEVSMGQEKLTKFTSDPETYAVELKSLFEKKASRQKKEAAVFLKQFDLFWHSDLLTDTLRGDIYFCSNLMLERKLNPLPYFKDYLLSVENLLTSDLDEKSRKVWLNEVIEVLENQRGRQVRSFFEESRMLLASQVLSAPHSVVWRYDGGQWNIIKDSVLKFSFTGGNLICQTKGDSTNILNTSGVYVPSVGMWYGDGGRLNWTRAEFAPDEVYAKFFKYQIALNKADFSVDSVLFYHQEFFDEPIVGTLTERVLNKVDSLSISYPRFSSNDHQIVVNSIFEDINYMGGFTIEGRKVIGSGSELEPAVITINKNEQPFIRLKAKTFIIYHDRIVSRRVAVRLLHNGDSIIHPGIFFRYDNNHRRLSLIQSRDPLSKSPYTNSFHDVDMSFEALNWTVGDTLIHLEKGPGLSRAGTAMFESSQFYSGQSYGQLAGIDAIHPLDEVYMYMKKHRTNWFYIYELQMDMKIPVEQVKAIIVNLASRGFVLYDIDNEIVHVKQRLVDYLEAKSGKKDYDVIRFFSKINSGDYGTLNLNTFDLQIHGVPYIQLSDSQKVFIYPYNSSIVLKQNRNFLFSGRIRAGNFEFFTSNSYFDYEQFKLEMPEIDSISFKVKENNPPEGMEPAMVDVGNVLADLEGELLIDRPDNKSGKEPFSEYPVFNSTGDGYVYYDNAAEVAKAYDKDKFHYHVEPFSIDSLTNFTTEGLEFKGSLISGGVFPELKQNLKVQEDYSLGFVNKVPDEGIAIYNGKGIYYSDVLLSNKGLQGGGKIDYDHARMFSGEFNFYPDSMIAVVDSFYLKERKSPSENPDVRVRRASVRWQPELNLVRLKNDDTTRFNMYHNEVKLDGVLMLTSAGTGGRGKLDLEKVEMTSGVFVFNHHKILSDTVFFKFKSQGESMPALASNTYRSELDFEQRKGRFFTQGETVKVNFPLNQYYCFMDQFEWKMDDDQVVMSHTEGQNQERLDSLSYSALMDEQIKGASFVSIDPKQDSLSFIAESATYSIKDFVLNPEGVRYFNMADGVVFPFDGKISISKNGVMDTLNDAIVLADTIHKAHKIYNARVVVKGKDDFRASGYVDYVDMTGKVWPLLFSDIGVDTSMHIIGTSSVKDKDEMWLSPAFAFKGSVALSSIDKDLIFDGAYRIKQDCDESVFNWVRFSASVDADSVILPVKQDLLSDTKTRLNASVIYSVSDRKVYPGFLTAPTTYSDVELLPARGFIMHDPANGMYKIGSRAFLSEQESFENQLSYKLSDCKITGSGEFNMGMDFGRLKTRVFGDVAYYVLVDSTVLRSSMIVDFHFTDAALNIMAQEFAVTNLRGIKSDSKQSRRMLFSLLGKQKAQGYLEEMQLMGIVKKMPAGLVHTLSVSEVQFIYNEKRHSWISEGKIGIGRLGKNQIGKYIDGYIEVAPGRTGDRITIYFELNKRQWYFFDYANGILQTISSNEAYNELVSGVKEKKRTLKGGDDKASFQYIISTSEKRNNFLRRIKAGR